MDAILQLDQNILLFIQEYIRHDWMDWFWKGITHLGDFGIFWILLTIVLLIPKKTRKAGLASALALIIGTLITNVAIKNVVARIRPYEVIQELDLMIEKQKDSEDYLKQINEKLQEKSSYLIFRRNGELRQWYWLL